MSKAPRPTLRWFDRLLMILMWLVTSGVVYVFGYYVGRGTPEHPTNMEERAVRLPVTSTPPPEGQRPKEAQDFPSFYQALPAGERPIDVARGTPVTAPETPPSTAPPHATTTQPAAHATAATSTTLVRTTPTPPPTRAMPPPISTPTTTPSAPRPLPSTSLPAGTPPASPPSTVAPRTSTRGTFTVEASPTRSRTEAEQLLGTLRRRGYDATLVQVERDGDTWYRLRVGRYATADQATDAMRRLRDVEGVTHVFVAAE